MTQVFTGHGCFGEYLWRIGKEATTRCHHCEVLQDSAQHTLVACPAWAGERRVLTRVVGDNLTLEVLIGRMLDSQDAWEAVSVFCEAAMQQKEAAERERESRGDPHRRGRVGRGRWRGRNRPVAPPDP
ncbi:uncharacterized protein LOC122403465 [Colletes gigas]|uniref:uncharacterized protein LOC122403465 n=1 Tax=Colletes gigas TaxID=935657 RepID=UPI001C9A7D1C|nr:uncharacterized protein LOC122403465 [Colletes gigas]